MKELIFRLKQVLGLFNLCWGPRKVETKQGFGDGYQLEVTTANVSQPSSSPIHRTTRPSAKPV